MLHWKLELQSINILESLRMSDKEVVCSLLWWSGNFLTWATDYIIISSFQDRGCWQNFGETEGIVLKQCILKLPCLENLDGNIQL